VLGLYDSADASVVAWQLDLIRYCGVDYVIFEMNPETDWGFPTVEQGIEAGVGYLRRLGMRWSFLLDAKSGASTPEVEARDEVAQVQHMYRSLERRGWTDGLVRGPGGKPLLFVFAPLRETALILGEECSDDVEWRMPIFLPDWHWDVPLEVRMAIPRRFRAGLRARYGWGTRDQVRQLDLLAALGYVSFWGESVRNHGGFCAVIPGYDDALLKRQPQLAPQVDRRGGDTLREQFRTAAGHRPEHVIVYGWNEYFENTGIEPTRQFGMTYVELLRSLIAEARSA